MSKAKELKRKIAASKKTRTETRKQFAKQQTACKELARLCVDGLEELITNAARGYIFLDGDNLHAISEAARILEERK